jgi:hypothetical protein
MDLYRRHKPERYGLATTCHGLRCAVVDPVDRLVAASRLS